MSLFCIVLTLVPLIPVVLMNCWSRIDVSNLIGQKRFTRMRSFVHVRIRFLCQQLTRRDFLRMSGVYNVYNVLQNVVYTFNTTHLQVNLLPKHTFDQRQVEVQETVPTFLTVSVNMHLDGVLPTNLRVRLIVFFSL